MQKLKKALAVLIVLALSLSCLSVIYGAEPATSGTCGNGLTWSLNTQTGMLTISGSGAMTDEQMPWGTLKNNIRSVYISAGVTHIGHWAFSGCTTITHVLYAGTQAQWNAMTIGEDNAYLTSAVRHYSASAATLTAVSGCTHTKINCGVCNKTVATVAGGSGHSYKNGVCTACGTQQVWQYAVAYNGDVTITGYAGTAADVQVPATIENLPVIAIGAEAFRESSVVNVTISEGVTSVGDSAFYDCIDLKTVVLPETLTSLGANAFFFCESLTQVNLPAGITRLEADTFACCSALEQITLPENLTVIDDYAFFECTALKAITLPEGLTAIEDSAFFGCSGLTEVIIPEGVTTIGNNAFRDCTSLVNVEIAEGPQRIGSWAFGGCSALKTITIPTSVTRVANNAFYNCTSLKTVNYYGTQDQWKAIYVESNNTPLTNASVKYEADAAIFGDMNGNRVVTDADAIYLHNHMQSPDNYPIDIEKDINGDGIVDDADALYLLRHSLFPERYPLG